MARVCKITGKRPLVGNNVSKSNRKTKRRQIPNLQSKRIYVPELGKFVQLKVSVTALKTIDRLLFSMIIFLMFCIISPLIFNIPKATIYQNFANVIRIPQDLTVLL